MAMLTRAAVVSILLAAAAAHADSTLVVVTPNAPVVVPTAPGAIPPGAEEEPPAPPAPAPVPVTPSAPQNEAWSNVSHINGTPVPVGERNRYLYKFKKTNLAANPFGLMFGYYDASASFAVNQNIALSVSGAYYSLDHTSGYQVTASAPLFFRRTFSGPYLEPGVILRSTQDRGYYDYGACIDTCSNAVPSDDWAGIEMLFGWQWTFDSGLNVAMAFGVARHLASNRMSSSDDNADANGYFRVGYAF
jgi:hypothetical protein